MGRDELIADVQGEVDVQTTRSGTLRKSLASHSVEQTTDRVWRLPVCLAFPGGTRQYSLSHTQNAQLSTASQYS